MKRSRTPITVVTGFLGSGKTTLINRILAEESGIKIGVIVNEFGAVGVDGELLGASDSGIQIRELANGCVCCVVKNEFRAALKELLNKNLDHIIVETSGAADPSEIIKILWGDVEISKFYELTSVICVLDLKYGKDTLDKESISLIQAACADVLWFSKSDQVVEPRKNIEELLNGVSKVSSAVKFLNSIENTPLELLDPISRSSFTKILESPSKNNSEKHKDLVSFSRQWIGEISKQALQRFFQTIVQDKGLLRIKAILQVAGEKDIWAVHGVRDWLEKSKFLKARASKQGIHENRLVVLGNNLDLNRIEAAFNSLQAAHSDAPLNASP